LVLPPKVAVIQVVIIPVIHKGDDNTIVNKAKELFDTIKKAGIRVELDDREHHNPGFKYNYWEL